MSPERSSSALSVNGSLWDDGGPSDTTIESEVSLAGLRGHEASLLSAMQRHEHALRRLRSRYSRVRQRLYDHFKQEQIQHDNAELGRFQAGCPKLTGRPTKQQIAEQALCLQDEAKTVDDSALGLLMQHHLLTQPVAPAKCAPFRQLDLSQLTPAERACMAVVGDATWGGAEGLEDSHAAKLSVAGARSGAGSPSRCGRRWAGAGEARCLLRNKDVLFMGNSVTRRQMYTVLDLLAGPRAHRQLNNFTDVWIPEYRGDPLPLRKSWIWDNNNHTMGYHAAQLITVDLETGDHRLTLPHEQCGVTESYSIFNPGRNGQWRFPGLGGGSEELHHGWESTKWATREWRPLISMAVDLDVDPADVTDACAARQFSWAGAYPGAISSTPAIPSGAAQGGRRRRASSTLTVASRIRARVLREVELFFASKAPRGDAVERTRGLEDVREWLSNVSVHIESPLPGRSSAAAAFGAGGALASALSRRKRFTGSSSTPNVWIYFPTYNGERESFNGFCEDKSCECTDELAPCHRHPECKGKHMCKPWPSGRSKVHVDRAIAFANALRAHGYIQLGKRSASTGASSLAPFAPRNGPKLRVRAVRVTPFYDDVWPERGRCQGMRPCKEPVDQAYIHRATAMMCPAYAATGGWQARLREAKSWIPEGHPSASLLYLYDGQTTDLLRETFETWNPLTVGYGSHAFIFGPQFGMFHGASEWRETFSRLRASISRSDACLGRTTALLFRSPAFNFDPVNSQEQQAQFGSLMRPLVEEAVKTPPSRRQP